MAKEILEIHPKERSDNDRFTWKGLDNASIHTSLAICVFYAVTIAAIKMGKPEQARSITTFK